MDDYDRASGRGRQAELQAASKLAVHEELPVVANTKQHKRGRMLASPCSLLAQVVPITPWLDRPRNFNPDQICWREVRFSRGPGWLGMAPVADDRRRSFECKDAQNAPTDVANCAGDRSPAGSEPGLWV